MIRAMRWIGLMPLIAASVACGSASSTTGGGSNGSPAQSSSSGATPSPTPASASNNGSMVAMDGAVTGQLPHVVTCSAFQAVVGGTINGTDYALLLMPQGGGSAILNGGGHQWASGATTNPVALMMTAAGGQVSGDLRPSNSNTSGTVSIGGSWHC